MNSESNGRGRDDPSSSLQHQIRQTFKTALDNSQSHLIAKIFPSYESFSAAIAAADFVDAKVKYKDGDMFKAKKKFLHELISNPWLDLQSDLNQWIWEEVLKFHLASATQKKSALIDLEDNSKAEIEQTALDFIRKIRNERDTLKQNYQRLESDIQKLVPAEVRDQICKHWMDYLIQSPLHRSYLSMAKLIYEQGMWVHHLEDKQFHFENLQRMIRSSKGIWMEIFCIASSVNFEQFNQGIWNVYNFDENAIQSKNFQEMVDRVVQIGCYTFEYFSSDDDFRIHPFVLLRICEVEYQCKMQCKLFEKSLEWIIRAIVQYQCIPKSYQIYLEYFSQSRERAILHLLKLTLEQLLKKKVIYAPWIQDILLRC